MITHERLLELVHYDPETGAFTWKIRRRGRAFAGMRAGSRMQGYWALRLDGVSYKAHRVAWFYVYGQWPKQELDHINRVRGDDRIANLREATRRQNIVNARLSRANVSGYRGVSWHKVTGKWIAQISDFGKKRHLGLFTTPQEAYAAYVAAAKAIHGEFLCLSRPETTCC